LQGIHLRPAISAKPAIAQAFSRSSESAALLFHPKLDAADGLSGSALRFEVPLPCSGTAVPGANRVAGGGGFRRRRGCRPCCPGIQLALGRRRLPAPLFCQATVLAHFAHRISLTLAKACSRPAASGFGSAFQPIDVVVDEGIGMSLLNSEHGLVYRRTLTDDYAKRQSPKVSGTGSLPTRQKPAESLCGCSLASRLLEPWTARQKVVSGISRAPCVRTVVLGAAQARRQRPGRSWLRSGGNSRGGNKGGSSKTGKFAQHAGRGPAPLHPENSERVLLTALFEVPDHRTAHPARNHGGETPDSQGKNSRSIPPDQKLSGRRK